MVSFPLHLAAQYGPENGEWIAYGGDKGSTRYSPLDQIDPSNVDKLEVAWRWSARNFGPTPETNYEVTPLMVNGVIYATAGYRRDAVAIDAKSGETLWIYRMDEGRRGEMGPRVSSGRGVAYWPGEEGTGARIYDITPGYHMVALDAETGEPVPEFGTNGVVDLFDTVRRPEDLDPTGLIGSSSPPIVVGNVLVVGSALHVGMRPPTIANIPGDVRGFDARTGKLLWTFHVIPEDGEKGADTWENGSNRIAGNGGVWTVMSADPELGLVYLPTEASTHDYYGGHRPGDNLWTDCIIALDAKTGEMKWSFQDVHHDVWDYDNPAPPVLVDINVDGKPIKAIAEVNKQTFVWVLDRETGKPVWPVEERPVPQDDAAPGEVLSPTQPFPTKPPALNRQGVTEDDVVDFTPELHQKAMKALEHVKLGPLYTPAVVSDSTKYKATLLQPGNTGGADWEGASVDPETGILYVPTKLNPSAIGLVPGGERSEMRYVVGAFAPTRVDGVPILKPPYGLISAVDLNEGTILWQIPNSDTPEEIKNNPALEGVDLPVTGHSDKVGVLTTKTLLLAGEGPHGDPALRAIDKATGDVIARIPLPASQTGIPMSYMVDGKQYVVVAVGDQDNPAELVALALP